MNPLPLDAAHAAAPSIYAPKNEDPFSSHSHIVRILERVLAPRPAPAILDVGCGSALLFQVARTRAPRLAAAARWVGCDRDRVAIGTAAALGVEAHVVDLANATEPPCAGPFDAVVFGDVLEHLAEPERLLEHWLPRVCDADTIVLASLPNVANLAVRLSLLAGRFEYDDRGILDRTHLRFYTKKSATEMLSACGLRILRCHATAVPLHLAWAPLRSRPRLGAALQYALAGPTFLWPTLLGFQFVFEARFDVRSV